MDPLTALSTAGTVLQFVDFGSKLINASVKLYNKGELDVHEQAKSATNDILDYAVKLRRSLLQSDGSSTPPELTDDEKLLESICKECDELARDLLRRLKKLSVPQDKKGAEKIWPTLTAAFKSAWNKEDLQNIQDRLDTYRRAIDSRVIQFFSQKVDSKFLEQSERFDRLDAANKDIAIALVRRNSFDNRALETQFAALSTLLDRAEAVVISQENINQRVLVDVSDQAVFASEIEENTDHLARIREKERKIRRLISDEILQSLHFETISERFENVDENHMNTFGWIFRSDQDGAQNSHARQRSNFRSWLESGTGIYWVNGKAGSGKSTLMKYIVNHRDSSSLLRSWAGGLKLCIVYFFFWNSGTSMQCSQAGLFRSLLYSTLSQHPELIPTVLPTHWAKRYSAACQDKSCTREVWDLSGLQKAFINLVSQTDSQLKICLFIDGLDEYEGNEADIAEIFGRASISENVKICCSSRPHQPFEDAFADRPRLRLQDRTMPDMRKYIHDKLEKSPRMQELSRSEPKETEKLIEEIAQAANGVFLWVRLVVMSLLRGLGNHDDIAHLQMRLKVLPKELDDLFDQMIFKVDEVYRQETAQIFQLVGSAYRPRSQETLHGAQATAQLSILLLSFAMERDAKLAVQAEPSSFDKEKVASRCRSMEIHLRTRSGGLLEVQYGTPSTTLSPGMKISYLHRTVRDHLEKPKIRDLLERQTTFEHKDPYHASSAIFKAHVLILKAFHATDLTETWTLVEDGLAWARRAEQDTGTSHPALLDEFYRIAHHLWTTKRSFKTSYSPLYDFFIKQQSALTLATQCGLDRYLDAKLPHIKKDETHTTLLNIALTPRIENDYLVNLKVVSTLLSHGANPNARLAESPKSLWQHVLSHLNTTVSRKPEHIALLQQWAPIITMLLKSGANPDAGCSEPQRYKTSEGRRVFDDSLWTPDEIVGRIFGSDPQRLGEVGAALEEARLELRRKKELQGQEKAQERGTGTCCCLVQ